MAVCVIPNRPLTQPYSISHPQVLRERLLIIARHHARIAHLHVRKEPLFGYEQPARAIHIDPSTFENETLSVVGPQWIDQRKPRQPLDLAAYLGITGIVVILGPAVEAP